MRYSFGDYILDTQRHELQRAGEPIKLRRKVFHVLAYLLAHHERVVPKQELLERLWPDQFVGDEALKSCIKTVRQALGDSARTPHFLRTVHGQGYRFVVAVEAHSDQGAAVLAPAALATSGPAATLLDEAAAGCVPLVPAQREPPGTPPSMQVTPSDEGPPAPDTLEAERRQLTVLVCRLVGLPAERAGSLDPEALLEVVPGFHRLCAEVVGRYAGCPAQDQGDGLVVYFGYPHAHEDDARRAVLAGLTLVEAMARFNAPSVHARGVRWAVRVGIHTGLVVMRTPRHSDSHVPLALGQPPTLAAQVHDLAPPDTVVVSPATLRLVEGEVVTRACATVRVADSCEPLVVYRVLQHRAIPRRSVGRGTGGVPPLVGREHELGLLRERWVQARAGLGQIVLLSGEAGIGKSRLVQEFTTHLAEDVHARIEYYCSPYAQQSAFYPVIEELQRRFQWRQETTPEEKFHTLEAALASAGLVLDTVVPLLAALLDLPLPPPYAPLTLEPQRQKQQTLEALVAWWHTEAARQPLCLLVEDVHWVDPSTLELLSLLLDQVPTVPMLVLLLGRPEFHPSWSPRSYLLHLTLLRLARPQVETLVASLTGGKVLPTEVGQQLVATTDGVPLFVEEWTKMILDSGLVTERDGHYALTGPWPLRAIPATLHDSLMARLDRLREGKRVAQLAAVIGRQFPYGVLRAVAPWDEPTLQRALGQLVDAELLYPHGSPPEATYLFKHALIQEAAYQSLLHSTRQHCHRRIAQALAVQLPATAETQPELLAHHYTEAGLMAHALPYWHQAGQRAIARSAYVEARQHLTTGLGGLATVPETPARRQHELDLLTAFARVLAATRGPAAPELEPVLTRAMALAQLVGEPAQQCAVLRARWGFHNVRLEYQAAQVVAEQLLAVAQRQRDPALLLGAHHALGVTLINLGAFAAARTHHERVIALADAQQHAPTPTTTRFIRYHDGVVSRAMVAGVLWELGYPDQAGQRGHEALTLAHTLAHPFTLVEILRYSARLAARRREWPRVQAHAATLLALATEHGFARYVGFGVYFQGWALAGQGQGAEGIVQMQQSLNAWRAMGIVLGIPEMLAQLAAAYEQVGQVAEALHLVEEALAMIETSGGHRHATELHRLHGALLLQRAIPEALAAEACFQQALDIARRQEAKSWELRAATSLARLWQSQGKHAEARELLVPIYGWFTEGFDTADLQEAKALLEELGGSHALAPSAAATVGSTASQRGATAHDGQP